MRLLVASLILVAACDGGSGAAKQAARDSLTQRQKDSLTAQSALPGAKGVGGALAAQDSQASRNRALDSIAADQ
jgi:hypothetical protein